MLRLIQTNKSYDEIEAYLREKNQHHPEDLKKELCQDQGTATGLLNLAIQKGDEKLVKLFINYGVPITDADQKISEYKPSLAALLRTRNLWRERALKIADARFESTLHLIETKFQNENVQGKEGVWIFGISGHGKSTFVNFLLGVDFQIVGSAANRSVVALDAKSIPAKVGDGYTSETNIPQVYSNLQSISNNVLIDMPGFGDTRGKEIEIGAAICRQYFLKQLSKIRSIVFVCDIKAFTQTPPTQYYEVAKRIGRIINCDVHLNVVLVITKNEISPVSKEEIQKKLTKIAEVYEKKLEKDERAIFSTTKAVLMDVERRLHLARVNHPEDRLAFFAKLHHLTPQPKELFNFTNSDFALEKFLLFVEEIARQFNLVKTNLLHNQTLYVNLAGALKQVEACKGLNIDIFDFHVLKDLPFPLANKHRNSYILKIDVDIIRLYYIKNDLDIQQIVIRDAKKFLEQLKKFKVETHQAGQYSFSKEAITELISKNSLPSHSPKTRRELLQEANANFLNSFENFCERVRRAPAFLSKTVHYTTITATLAMLYSVIIRRFPQLLIPRIMPERIERYYFWQRGGAAIIGGLVYKKLFPDSSAAANDVKTKFDAFKAASETQEETQKALGELEGALTKASGVLVPQFEREFFELDVNQECYKKLATVIDAIDLSKHDVLKKFIEDIRSLDKFLATIKPSLNPRRRTTLPTSNPSPPTPMLMAKL